MYNNVVMRLFKHFAAKSFTVVCFNFRGVGNSTGSGTSHFAKAEGLCYQRILQAAGAATPSERTSLRSAVICCGCRVSPSKG